ncbi:MAG: MbcA/ParS/Xre antitoxin family protein [Rhodanobacteraceae bacterium]
MKTTSAASKAATRDLSGPVLRTFFRIADLWRLTAGEQRHLLGDPPPSTFFKWKQGHRGTLSRDVLERISYMLGIYKALEILLPAPERADAWVRTANTSPVFGGRAPLDRMLSGNVADLYVVRQYLDANRGGS